MAGKVFRMPAIPPKVVIAPPKIDFQSGGSGSDVFFQASGLEALAENLRTMPKFMRRIAGIKMADIAHEIMDISKDQYVPFASGALHDSGDADEYNEQMDTEITEIAMWYGAPGWFESSPFARTTLEGEVLRRYKINEGMSVKNPSLYALEQHETLYANYTKYGTGPKYLEIPYNERAPRMAREIAETLGISLGTGGV